MSQLTRRESLALIAGAAVCATCGSHALADEKKGPEKPPVTTGKVEVGKVDKYKEDRMYDEYRPKGFMLSRTDGYLFAIGTKCTHKGAAIKIDAKDNKILKCPAHGAQFSETGSVIKGQAKISLTHFGISKKEDGTIVVDLDQTFADKDWEKEGAFLVLEEKKKD